MAKKEITQSAQVNDKKLRTKDLIFAGAFGAIYIVLMLGVVMVSGMVPILYLISPLTVGLVCGTVYELCVLKVHKFGAALILGVLFAVVACSGHLPGMALAVGCALLAELVLLVGKYKSKKMFLLSFVLFNLNMLCPFTQLWFRRDAFLSLSANYYGQAYADGVAALATDWMAYAQIGLAVLGGVLGALIASGLIRKHFQKAGIL